MLYLVKLQGKEQTLLKIGHTKDIEKRIKTYQTHNPLIELLDYKEGNSADEAYLRNKLKKFLFKDSKEWFVENPEIYKLWDSYNQNLKYNTLEIQIFKKLLYVAKYINPINCEYMKINLGIVPGFKEDDLFNFFIKKDFNITKSEYKEYINNLISKGFLIQTNDLDKDIFILNNAEIEKVSNSNFNTF